MRGKKIFALVVVAIIAVFCIVFTILRFEGTWGTKVVEETIVPEPVVVPEEPIPEIAEEPFEEIEDAEVQPESFEIIRRGYVIGDAALNATIGDESALITFSSNVSSSDMEAFIKNQNALYDLADSGVSYKIVAPGTIVVDYPEGTDSSTVLYWLEKLIGNAEEYMEKEEEVVELPVEEETPVVEVPVVPSAPVMLEPVVETTVVEDDIVAVVDDSLICLPQLTHVHGIGSVLAVSHVGNRRAAFMCFFIVRRAAKGNAALIDRTIFIGIVLDSAVHSLLQLAVPASPLALAAIASATSLFQVVLDKPVIVPLFS